MDLVHHQPLIEEVLSAWGTPLGAAREPYRGHVYRVFNVARRLLRASAHDEELATASVFHDLGIWSDATFDYLAPSILRSREHIATRAPHLDSARVAEIIDLHHRLRRVTRGPDAEIVEAFRLADRVDVSRRLLGAGLDRAYLRELLRAFPYTGFHSLLVRTAVSWFVRHPFQPLPMLRF
jgi:hypothetical protein